MYEYAPRRPAAAGGIRIAAGCSSEFRTRCLSSGFSSTVRTGKSHLASAGIPARDRPFSAEGYSEMSTENQMSSEISEPVLIYNIFSSQNPQFPYMKNQTHHWWVWNNPPNP